MENIASFISGGSSDVELHLGIPEQLNLLRREPWQTLIVLDACRYDYFAEEVGAYLEGELSRAWSPGYDTYSWLGVVFSGEHSVTVYSAHPALNSLGVPRGGYLAKPHFARIVDIWRDGWASELSTVPPEAVNRVVLRDVEMGRFVGRNIVWYMQPHAPWIGETKITGFARDWNDKDAVLGAWRDAVAGRISLETLRAAYRDNLRLVLAAVSELIPHLGSGVVVTADHWEMLGEGGVFEHPGATGRRLQREVPWLEIGGCGG
jgi:hypothetical protein